MNMDRCPPMRPSKMTLERLASLLCCPAGMTREHVSQLILPPWCDDEGVQLTEYFQQVSTLRKQRDELVALWPAKRDILNRQCSEAIMEVAAELNEKLTPEA